jgi:hypothetical protein
MHSDQGQPLLDQSLSDDGGRLMVCRQADWSVGGLRELSIGKLTVDELVVKKREDQIGQPLP